MASRLQLLIDLGFELAGEWLLIDGQLSYKLSKHQQAQNILYAFISDEDVKYIGKSTRSLDRRMYNYKNADSSQPTNYGNHRRLKQLLEIGTQVQIFAFVNQEPLAYRGIPINLAAGLEDELIKRLTPPWNGTTTD